MAGPDSTPGAGATEADAGATKPLVFEKIAQVGPQPVPGTAAHDTLLEVLEEAVRTDEPVQRQVPS